MKKSMSARLAAAFVLGALTQPAAALEQQKFIGVADQCVFESLKKTFGTKAMLGIWQREQLESRIRDCEKETGDNVKAFAHGAAIIDLKPLGIAVEEHQRYIVAPWPPLRA